MIESTLQALALLAHRHLEEEADRPNLLAVPTSLVGNWVREAARFVPGLRVLVLHGPARRKRFADIPDHHLAVTTYPLLDRDGDALFGHDGGRHRRFALDRDGYPASGEQIIRCRAKGPTAA